MGFFSDVFGKVKTFFTETIPDTVSAGFNKVKSVVSGVIDTGKTVVVTLHQDVKDYVGGVKDTVQGITKSAEKVVINAEDKVSEIGKSFSWPLAIGAAGVVGILLLKK